MLSLLSSILSGVLFTLLWNDHLPSFMAAFILVPYFVFPCKFKNFFLKGSWASIPFLCLNFSFFWGVWPDSIWSYCLAFITPIPFIIFYFFFGNSLNKFDPLPRVLFLSLLYTLTEWLRSLSPIGISGIFPLTQYDNPYLLFWSSVVGLFPLCFLFIYLNYSLALLIREKNNQRLYLVNYLAICSLVLLFCWTGAQRIKSDEKKGEVSLNVGVVGLNQPAPSEFEQIGHQHRSVITYLKYREFKKSSDYYLDFLIKNSREISNYGQVDFFVWPETSLQVDPHFHRDQMDRINTLIKDTNAKLFIPYLTPAKSSLIHYNRLSFFGHNQTHFSYDKQKASFFSEYTEGKKSTQVYNMLVDGKIIKLAPLICFDFDFLSVPRNYAKQGINLFIAPSDDGYLKISKWHYKVVSLQAALHQVTMIKSDAGYISTIVDYYGRVLNPYKILPDNSAALFYKNIPLGNGRPTHYSTYGDVFIFYALCLLLGIGLFYGLSKKKSQANIS
jgi:apolipoprotein N-acyltransferase